MTILSLDQLASDPLTHRFGDLFNPPALTNFRGCAGAALDVTGIRHISFPPFSSGETVTAALRYNRRHAQSLGCPVTFRWFPDRIERSTVINSWKFRSTTVIPMDMNAIVVDVEAENLAGRRRTLELGWTFQGRTTKSVGNWTSAIPPSEPDNRAAIDRGHGRILFTATNSDAVTLQGVLPVPDRLTHSVAESSVTFAAGETQRFTLFWVADDNVNEASATYDQLVSERKTVQTTVRSAWEAEWRGLFTPGNGRYSGHLPELTICDDAIEKVYAMGALGLAYFRRDSPYSQVGRTYDTLMPRYWPTAMVLWDYSLSAMAHAMLDPAVMRTTLERWMRTDVHTHFGTCYLTGDPIGPWYAVNDYAMASMIEQYVIWSGDQDWLSRALPGAPGNTKGEPKSKQVIAYLTEYANNWKQFRQPSGLAGYGGLFNLLECVSSYVHEVASLNAANVRIMRGTAALLDLLGRHQDAASMRKDAEQLLADLWQLYVPELGCWNVRNRNQELVTVRHAYDLLTVLNCIPDQLLAGHRREMTDFFVRELKSDTWMRALSEQDQDAMFSLRPDHQWNGAYPAWPPETAKGLCRIGQSSLAFEWMQGLARSANQGPFGQAHFTDSAVGLESGGAIKASAEAPYINDWHSSSSGSWLSAIIEGLLGIRVTPDGLTASFCDEAIDCGATLSNIPFQGTNLLVCSTNQRPVTM